MAYSQGGYSSMCVAGGLLWQLSMMECPLWGTEKPQEPASTTDSGVLQYVPVVVPAVGSFLTKAWFKSI